MKIIKSFFYWPFNGKTVRILSSSFFGFITNIQVKLKKFLLKISSILLENFFQLLHIEEIFLSPANADGAI